jgi:hypothetical protein
VPPSFIPPVKSLNDTSMIDPVFTNEKVTLEDEHDDGTKLSAEKQKHFEGFTFVPDSEVKR